MDIGKKIKNKENDRQILRPVCVCFPFFTGYRELSFAP